MKEKIHKYKVEGKVYLWIYKRNSRNYPGWNFTGDNKGCDSLIELLEMMRKCEWSTKKTITTEEPTSVQLDVVNANREWRSKKKLTLHCKKTKTPEYWQINENYDEIEIQFGTTKLVELIDSIKGILEGKGDFVIADDDDNDDSILYFWWNLEKERHKYD